MKRLLLLVVLFLYLLGAVGCMNKSETNNSKVDKPTSTPTKTLAKNKPTSVPTKIVNADMKDGAQSETTDKNNNAFKDISSFIPNGWHILEKNDGKLASAEGDLNQDGIMDKAVVIEGEDKPTESEYFGSPRSLLIAFKNKDNTYSLSIKADNAIMLRDQGGVFGDPLQDIKIERGSILLEFYGGSSSRWYMYYRFRYQNNGWYLIGATRGSYLSTITTMDNADEEDYNLLTGDYIIKKFEDGKIKSTKGNRGKRQLLNLKDFVPGIDESQF
jgi:hypothetical protein